MTRAAETTGALVLGSLLPWGEDQDGKRLEAEDCNSWGLYAKVVASEKRGMVSLNQQLWSLQKKKESETSVDHMTHQLLDPVHVLSTHALLALPPFRAFEPQLPSEPH